MTLARTARMIEATMPNLWDQADRMRDYVQDDQPPIERPEPVEDLCRPLSARLYPDCPLCGRDVNGCACDPDAYAEAVWLGFQREKVA